jgi:hypothetical protein
MENYANSFFLSDSNWAPRLKSETPTQKSEPKTRTPLTVCQAQPINVDTVSSDKAGEAR